MMEKIAEKIKRFFSPTFVIRNDWLDTPEGKRFEEVGCYVYDTLDKATYNVYERKIILENNDRLSVDEAASYLSRSGRYSFEEIRPHLPLWLGEAAEHEDDGQDPDDAQLEQEEKMLKTWIKEESRKG